MNPLRELRPDWSRLSLETPDGAASVAGEANDLSQVIELLVVPLLRAAGYGEPSINEWIPESGDPGGDRAVALREILDAAEGALAVDADCGDPERRTTDALRRIRDEAQRVLGET